MNTILYTTICVSVKVYTRGFFKINHVFYYVYFFYVIPIHFLLQKIQQSYSFFFIASIIDKASFSQPFLFKRRLHIFWKKKVVYFFLIYSSLNKYEGLYKSIMKSLLWNAVVFYLFWKKTGLLYHSFVNQKAIFCVRMRLMYPPKRVSDQRVHIKEIIQNEN